MSESAFQPGSIVTARNREWVVLPRSNEEILYLRPVGGGVDEETVLHRALEREPVRPSCFPPPTPEQAGTRASGLLLRDALMLKLRSGSGPFRSFGNIAVEPRAYQLVPLLMALKLETVRLLIADDVGVGKTIEAGLIVRELMDRGEADCFTVLCPPHLCEQWQGELDNRFHIHAEIVRSATAARLERGLPAGSSIFTEHPYTIVSLDYIKSKNRRDAFAEQCPDLVIVDEAHTCARSGQGRQLRYELLKDLSQRSDRHLILLTATPHSGDEEAFKNLLSLLDPEFVNIDSIKGAEDPLRHKLANHFVQRRRQDIREWQEGRLFPERLTAEATYRLTGAWGHLFDEVLDYARDLVEREREGTLKARMNWWAALALLRCISSSPQAAIRALQTRLNNAIDPTLDEATQAEELEALAANSVLDGSEEMGLSSDDVEPGAAQDEDRGRLQVMIEEARGLKRSADPKLKALVKVLCEMLEEGFRPVIFCRYIATAEYLGEELGRKFKDHAVTVVTGDYTPAEREQHIEVLKESDKPPLLVATDCLSEGINLQELFDAVIHYDLTWNPTRHEQREGRVDRFGQQAERVKCLMLYGEDNPVDGAVLRVIQRKAEAIRKALGVSVPVPEDDQKVTQAIVQSVLLHRHGGPAHTGDLFAELDQDLAEVNWESAREKARRYRTLFAQQRLKPEEVMPEWEKAYAVLGTEDDVERFVTTACERLEAPLMQKPGGGWHAPLQHLPPELKERLAADDLLDLRLIDFRYPSATGAVFIHRTHPLVSHLADYLAEQALDGEQPERVARAGALFTPEVARRSVLWLLRLRSRLSLRRGEQRRDMLAEEALAVVTEADEPPRLLGPQETCELMQAKVSRNMSPERRSREIETALGALDGLGSQFDALARQRAEQVLADHRRVREAAQARGEYRVQPQLPADVMGVYVLVPDRDLF